VTLLVDTNVLLDVLQDDPQWAEWSISQLRAQSQVHGLAINDVIYAELSLSFDSVSALDAVVARLRLQVEALPRPALFLAGKAFLQYRRRGGTKTQVLPDFFIGAQAAVNGWPVLTRDSTRYRSYFPTLQLLTP
jgi:predicted nucleic acid-binding protein